MKHCYNPENDYGAGFETQKVYWRRLVDKLKSGDLKGGSFWAGKLLHIVQDSCQWYHTEGEPGRKSNALADTLRGNEHLQFEIHASQLHHKLSYLPELCIVCGGENAIFEIFLNTWKDSRKEFLRLQELKAQKKEVLEEEILKAMHNALDLSTTVLSTALYEAGLLVLPENKMEKEVSAQTPRIAATIRLPDPRYAFIRVPLLDRQ